MVRLAALTKGEMNLALQVAFADILGNEPVESLIRGFDLAERSCTFLPSPAELLRLAGRSPEQLEEQEIAGAWNGVLDHLAKYGTSGVMPKENCRICGGNRSIPVWDNPLEAEKVAHKSISELVFSDIEALLRKVKAGEISIPDRGIACECTRPRLVPELPRMTKAAMREIGGLEAVEATAPEFKRKLREEFAQAYKRAKLEGER